MSQKQAHQSFLNKFRIVLYVSIGSVLALTGELMPDDFKSKIQNYVWNTFHISFFWVWLGFISLLTLWLIWMEFKKEGSQQENLVIDLSFESERDNIIKSFYLRYKNQYDQKLDERIILNLELSYSQKGTEKKFVDRYFAKEAKTESEIQKVLADIVEKFRYILIVGQPGAGKTTILLETAMILLDKSKQQYTAIPVIFNLSSWRPNYDDFGKWLIDMLVEGNGFSRKLAEEVISKNQIIPLLDGLDELSRLGNDKQQSNILIGQCLEALNQFLSTKNPEQMVICSRLEEYKIIEYNAPVKAEILIKPLKIEQIEKALKPLADLPLLEAKRHFANPTSAQNILYILQNKPTLIDSLCIPFYFHLATQVFDRQQLIDELPTDKENFENYLVSNFIEKKLKFSTNKIFENKRENLRWLYWLATHFNTNGGAGFEISGLQPSMLSKPRIYNIYIAFLFIILIGYLGFLSIINRTPIQGLSLIYIYLFLDQPYKIKTYDNRTTDWSYLKNKRIQRLVVNVSIVLVVGLTMNIGFFPAILIGTTFPFLLSWVLFSDKIKGFLEIHHPYQRLLSGVLLNCVKIALIVLLLSVTNVLILFGWGGVSSKAICIIAFFGLLIGFVFSSICRHFILRIFLFVEGSLPLRLVHFLDFATDELRFLEREGGRWRFRHQILKDYFINTVKRKI